jgi:hypothetical protein
MFEALHAGYNPDTTQTTIPIIIPSGTYMMLSGRKKYVVLPIIALTTE